jgi:hypothetical protein
MRPAAARTAVVALAAAAAAATDIAYIIQPVIVHSDFYLFTYF